jgi:GDP-4-dehydro-6-deoxy-D-mannose reductase
MSSTMLPTRTPSVRACGLRLVADSREDRNASVRVLVTGAGGFVGKYLTAHLRDQRPDAELHGTLFRSVNEAMDPNASWIGHSLDLRNPEVVNELIGSIRPDRIYHLAGQAFVPRSFEDPWETLEINIRSQLNLITACIAHNIRPRMLITASAEVYSTAEMPITESTPLEPSSPYSVSKAAQDLLGLQYYLSHDFPIFRVRAFNHLGPGQSERFVAPAFALQIAQVEQGLQEPVISVGDLSAKRDFTDVRDIVRAYYLLMEHGQPGEAYNVASGKARSIQSLLDTFLSFTKVPIQVKTDMNRLRPNRVPILEGDITRIQQATGWQPTITFEQTLLDILEDFRQRVRTTL